MQSFFKKLRTSQAGYITLFAIIIIGAIGTTVALSLLLSGINSSQTSSAISENSQAKALANTCAEIGLNEIRKSAEFSGTDTLILESGTCTYTATILSGSAREVTASSTVGTIVQKIKVEVDQLEPIINISSWQEVADF